MEDIDKTLAYLNTVDKYKGLAISIPQIITDRLGTPDWTTGVEELRLAVLSALTQLKLQIDSFDAVGYIGTWDATGALPTAPVGEPYKVGNYFVVSVAGTTDLSGITTWGVGDWAVLKKNDVWERIPNTATVTAVAGRQGSVILTKEDVGLDNVDNTADVDKPVSTATSEALALKVDAVLGKGLSKNDLTDALVTLINKNAQDILLLGTPVTVLDVLNSDSISDALSAHQGKELSLRITANATGLVTIDGRVTTAEGVINNHSTSIQSINTAISNLTLDDIVDSATRVAITSEEHSKMVLSDNYGHNNGIDADTVDGKHASDLYHKDNFNLPSIDFEAKDINCSKVSTSALTVGPSTRPATGLYSGQIVFDNADKNLYFWNDTEWRRLDT